MAVFLAVIYKVTRPIKSIKQTDCKDQQTNTVSNINELLKDVSRDTNNSVNAANSMAKESVKLQRLSQHMTDL